ncbi:MAG: addiction module toxin RelE [Paludibacteraceae bacterium]|nr:addiction module toxin RelE [Paludibacteraceae bacterium]
MTYDFRPSPDFERQAKKLAKHYPSFKKDLLLLLESLKADPWQGVDLGNGIRKVRMTISSKGRDKSGGARVITMNVNVDVEKMIIALLYIYDKAEMANVSDQFLQQIIKEMDV